MGGGLDFFSNHLDACVIATFVDALESDASHGSTTDGVGAVGATGAAGATGAICATCAIRRVALEQVRKVSQDLHGEHVGLREPEVAHLGVLELVEHHV